MNKYTARASSASAQLELLEHPFCTCQPVLRARGNASEQEQRMEKHARGQNYSAK
jgi:hypothetical protein